MNKQGFTLIELMIVIAIIGVVAAIALPNYQNYKIKTNRTVTQAEMVEIATKMNRYKASNRTYADATVSIINGGVTSAPTVGHAAYTLEFSPSPTLATGWTLIAKPIANSSQDGNGWICINDQGQKSWQKGVAACQLSMTSNWD